MGLRRLGQWARLLRGTGGSMGACAGPGAGGTTGPGTTGPGTTGPGGQTTGAASARRWPGRLMQRRNAQRCPSSRQPVARCGPDSSPRWRPQKGQRPVACSARKSRETSFRLREQTRCCSGHGLLRPSPRTPVPLTSLSVPAQGALTPLAGSKSRVFRGLLVPKGRAIGLLPRRTLVQEKTTTSWAEV